ncbi:MAG TPA: class II aldolase/adducin family protein [Verrucomicrobiae bacterium]|nr:class II aldolase/adducin family protein [Verrucomicrobiae bacterium]
MNAVAPDLAHPRDQILDIMERIYRYRMTTTSGGNVSLLDAAGDIWITPSRVDKGGLARRDIVRLPRDGSAEGPHPPSSELPFHRAIYAARPDLRAIVHAHPVALVAFSITGRAPDTRLFPQARHMCGEPGFAPYALPGSAALGESIASVFGRGFSCVVMENHGVVVGGTTAAEAFQRFEALEFVAKTIIKAAALGGAGYLEESRIVAALDRRARWSELPPASAGSGERELRRELCDFVRRGCRQRLLISTEGSFSARLDGDRFLITPAHEDRYGLRPADIVLVRGDACEAGKIPSRAAPAHRAIYGAHPDVQAIVFAHPVNATAFSVAAAPFDARTIPESYILLRDVPRLPFGMPYGDGPALAASVSMERPAALLENDGALVVGRGILDAFDRLEVLEATAEAVINSQSIGAIAPMPDAALSEIRRAFFGEK